MNMFWFYRWPKGNLTMKEAIGFAILVLGVVFAQKYGLLQYLPR